MIRDISFFSPFRSQKKRAPLPLSLLTCGVYALPTGPTTMPLGATLTPWGCAAALLKKRKRKGERLCQRESFFFSCFSSTQKERRETRTKQRAPNGGHGDEEWRNLYALWLHVRAVWR